MAEEILVEKKIEAGEELIRALQTNNFSISAASWVQEDGGLWYLYLASKLVDEVGSFDAYKKLNALLRQVQIPSIDPLEIKLISTINPMTKEILRLHAQYPAPVHTSYRLHELGGMRIGEAHIYPPVSVP